MDQTSLFAMMLRAWQLVAGGLTLLLIPYWLTKEHQGYYFLFNSIVGLQLVFELGLSQVILQMLGTSYARTKQSQESTVEPIADYHEVGALVQFFRRWYAYAAVCFFFFSSAAATLYFHYFSTTSIELHFLLLGLLACVSIVLYQSGQLAMLETCGEMLRVTRLRLLSSFIGYVTLWVGALVYPTIWWMIMPMFFSAVITVFWLKREILNSSSVLTFLINSRFEKSISWLQAVWPNQWRIGLSWISGYLITQLFVPVVFAIHGPEEAGQLGITLAAFTAAFAVSFSLIASKAPKIVELIAVKSHQNALNLYYTQLKYSLTICGVACVILICLQSLISQYNHPYSARFSETQVFYALALSTFANCLISSYAMYLRAHGGDPMLLPSLTQALLITTVLTQAENMSTAQLLFIHSAICIFITLPWTVYLFSRRRSFTP